jgi:tetratricopeptide (TPR) repeat protein
MKKSLILISLLILTTSQSASASYKQAVLAFEQNDIATALPLFKKTKDQIQSKIYLEKIFADKDLDDAEDWIDDAVKQDDNNAEAHYVRGIVMGRQASDSFLSALSYAKKSKKSFNRAAMLEPSSVKYQMGVLQFNVSAPSIAGGDIEEAIKVAEIIAKLDVKAGFEAHIEVAKAQEDLEQARQILAKAKAQYPTLPDFFYVEGMMEQQQENYAAAIPLLTAASQMDAPDEDSINAKYGAMYQIGRTSVLAGIEAEKGIGALQKFIEEAPASKELPSKDWAEFRLANIYECEGEKAKAMTIYKKLLKSEEKDLVKQVKKKT